MYRKLRRLHYFYQLAAAVSVIVCFTTLWFLLRLVSASVDRNYQTRKDVPTEEFEQTEGEGDLIRCDRYRRALDGVCVHFEEDINPRLVGIMIENHVDARPLSGISRAQVVYEAAVEGNITRFLVIFPAHVDSTKVGPVRSARPYYLDWISEYGGAMFMHVGGSPAALARISAEPDIFSINEFNREWYFWRSTDRIRPHNTYTSRNLWQEAWERYGDEQEPFESWSFEEDEVCEEDCVTEITPTFYHRAYEPTWRFNSSTEKYDRYEYGELVIDPETEEPISVDTIIIQRVETAVIDAVGRQRIETIGSGETIVFRDGKMIIGEWRKEKPTSRTVWLDSDGDAIPLAPGKIWVTVLDVNASLTIE